MTTYFDTSALVKLVIREDGSPAAQAAWRAADVLVVSALVLVEARAALAAARRVERLTVTQHRGAKAAVDDLLGSAMRIGVSDGVISAASDLAEQHALRGYDAIHLASALGVRARVMVSADRDLCAAAQRAGMHVANPTA